ncbi:hypothetical protein ACSFBC_25830 [Variovorax sp. LT1R16]
MRPISLASSLNVNSSHFGVGFRLRARRVDAHVIAVELPCSSEVLSISSGGIDAWLRMDAWNIARDNVEMSARIQKYLAPKLSDGSALRAFLEAADVAAVQAQFIRPMHWFLSQPGLEVVQRSTEDRIVHRLSDAGATTIRV